MKRRSRLGSAWKPGASVVSRYAMLRRRWLVCVAIRAPFEAGCRRPVCRAASILRGMTGDPLLDGVEWRRPSPRLLLMRRVEVAVAAVAAALAAGILLAWWASVPVAAAGIGLEYF